MSSLIATFPGPGSPSGLMYAISAIEYGVTTLDLATGGLPSSAPLWFGAPIEAEGGSLAFIIEGLEYAVSVIEVRLGGRFGELLRTYPGPNHGSLNFPITRLEYVVDELWDMIGPTPPTPVPQYITVTWQSGFLGGGIPTTTPFDGSIRLANARPGPDTGYSMTLVDPDEKLLFIDNHDGSWGINLNAQITVGGIPVGVNTHIEYTDGSYANVDVWCPLLVALGRPLVREQAPIPSSEGQAGWPTLIGTGCSFNLVCNVDNLNAVVPPLTLMSNIQTWFTDRSIIVSIEAPNELNNDTGATYTDRFGASYTGPDCAIPWMNDWLHYAALNPFFAGIPLVNCVSFPAIAPPTGVTFSNAHPYPHNGADPEATFIAEIAQQAQGLPIKFTEFGYATGNNGSDSVTEDQQSTLIMAGLPEAVALGVREVYIYELLDQKDADPLWGIYRTDYTPKPVVAPLTAYIAANNTDTAAYYAFTWQATNPDYTLARNDLLVYLSPSQVSNYEFRVPQACGINSPVGTEMGTLIPLYGPRTGNAVFIPEPYSLGASVGTNMGAFV